MAEYIIDLAQLNDLLATIERHGVNLTSVNWYELGLQLHLSAEHLEKLAVFFEALEKIEGILLQTGRRGGGQAAIRPHCSGIRACLSLWLRRVEGAKDPTLIILTTALMAVGEKNPAVSIFKEKLLDQALQDDHIIRTRWTTFSITGPFGSGKSSFLKLLINKAAKTPAVSEVDLHARKDDTVSIEPEEMSSFTADSTVMAMTNLMTARDTTTHSWERIDYESLRKMVASEVKSSTRLISLEPPKQNVAEKVFKEVGLTKSKSVVDQSLEGHVLQLLKRQHEKQMQVSKDLQQTQAMIDEQEQKLSKALSKEETKIREKIRKFTTEFQKHQTAREEQLDKAKQLKEHLSILQLMMKEDVIDLLQMKQPFQLLEGSILELFEHLHSHDNVTPELSLKTAQITSSILFRHGSVSSKHSSQSGSEPDSLTFQYTLTSQSSHSSFKTPKQDSLSMFQSDSVVEEIVDFFPNIPESNKLSTQAHFIYAIDTGCHPAFFDIAPALLSYNSVHIITHKLDEKVHSYSKSHQLTRLELLQSSVHTLSSLKPPELGQGATITKAAEKSNFIVLGTRLDKMGEEDEEDLDDKNYFIKTKLAEFGEIILRYGSSMIFPINNLSPPEEENTRKIFTSIHRKISKCYVEADIPLRWFLFQLELDRLRRVKPIVEKSVCVNIGAKFNMSKKEVKSALKYYHDVMVVMYFPQAYRKIVFLDPQSFLKLMAKFLTNTSQTAQDDGIFGESLVSSLFRDRHHSFTSIDFLQLLESLLIVVKLPDKSGMYFFPCILSRHPTNELDDLRGIVNGEVDPLVLKWEKGPVPQGLFPALVVHLLSKKNVKLCSESQRYQNVIQFNYEGAILLLLDSFNWLEIHFSGNSSKCQSVKEMIEKGIEEVIKVFNYDTIPTEYFLCSKHNVTDHLCTVHESKEMVTCLADNTSYLINTQTQTPWIAIKKLFKATVTSQQRNLSPKDIDLILTVLKDSKFRVRKWFQLGQALPGIPLIDLYNIDYDSTNQCLEECLKLWVKQKQEPATWDHLIAALSSIRETAAADYINQQIQDDLASMETDD